MPTLDVKTAVNHEVTGSVVYMVISTVSVKMEESIEQK